MHCKVASLLVAWVQKVVVQVLWANFKSSGLPDLSWCKLAGRPPSCQPLASSLLLSLPSHPSKRGPELSPGMTRFCGQTWCPNKVSGERAFLSWLRSKLMMYGCLFLRTLVIFL